jgi:hypothetical protein
MAKEITIIKNRRGRETEVTGTLDYLVNHYFKYALETGESWQHEKGNSKINTQPKSAKALVNNLNKAKTNSAANGAPCEYYRLKE